MSRVMRRRVMRRRPSGPSQSTGRSRGRSTQGRADMMRRLAAQRSLANRSSPKSAQGNLPQGKSKLFKSTRTPAQIAEARSRFQKRLRDQRKLPTRVSTPNSGTKRLGTPIPPSQKGSKVLKANVSPTTPTTRKRSRPKNVRSLRSMVGAARRRRLI